VLLGLVVANYQGANDWDKMDQTEWMRGPSNSSSSSNNSDKYGIKYAIKYAIHHKCKAFDTSSGAHGSAIHGYQGVCRPSSHHHHHDCVNASTTDVYNMSCTQGGWAPSV
jgi:hypothetical protein